MAEYICQLEFFFCVFMDQEGVKVHKLVKPISSHLDRTSLLDKGFIVISVGFWENFSCGIQLVVLSKQYGSILPSWVANHGTGFSSSCPLTELAIHV